MDGLLDSVDCDDAHTALPLLLHGSSISRSFLDSHTGDFVLHPPAPSHVPSNPPLPLPLATALSAPYSSQHCSFASTYYRHAQQLWRPCYTCNLIDANGCCSVCAVVCHAGHQLGEERVSNFFCDCGSRGPGLCLCLPESPYHSHSHSPATGAHKAAEGATAPSNGSADLSGGLSAGHQNVDLSAVASGVLAANKLTFRCDDRATLPERVRHMATQLLARDEKRRSRRREQRDSAEAKPTAVQVRRASSFTLGALASCLDETEEEEKTADELSPVLLAIGHYVNKQQPFSLRLTATERPLYDKVVQRYRRVCNQRFASRSGSTDRSLSTLIDTSLRLWLTVGGVEERLNAASMLLQCHLAGVTTLPPSITSFFSSFMHRTARFQQRILRTSRSTHHTELSTTANAVNFDLFCHSLALMPPTPSTTNLSPSSATAFSSISSASSAQQHGIYPSLTVSTDGAYLFFLSARYGVVRLGTGEGDSVAGELLAQNVELAVHAGGHLVCIRSRDSEDDMLLLRSPLLLPDALLRLDPLSLHVLESEVRLARGDSTPSEVDDWHPYELEYEMGARTPSTSTTPHWQPLAPLLQSSSDFASLSPDSYSLIKQCLASNTWKLNERCALSASVHLTVAAGGIVLVVEQTGQLPNYYRLRIKTAHRPLPLLPDQRYVHKGEAAPSQIASIALLAGRVEMEVFAASTRDGDAKEEEADVVREDAAVASVWKRVNRVLLHSYHHPLPVVQSNVPSTAASQPVSNSPHGVLSSSAILPTSALRYCDGCGLVDWREEDEFVCVDGCTNIRLCGWCQLHDRFNTATHSSQHHMDHRLPSSDPSSPADQLSLLQSELSGGVCFSASDRLVLLPPPLPLSTLRHWREFAVGDVVDVRDVYQKWYQADILAVNAADNSVLVHYQGWHTKWDEWISTNTDRFAPRGSLSSEKKAAGSDLAGHRHDGTEGGRKAVRQAARVLQLVQRGSEDETSGEQYEHCTDVLVRTRGQAFACLARTGQVWCIDEDGVLEAWNNDSQPTTTAQLPISRDDTFQTLAAASTLIADCPLLSAYSVHGQLSLIRTLLRPLLHEELTPASPEMVSMLLALLGYLKRVVHRLQRTQPTLTAETQAVMNEIRELLRAPLSQPALPEPVQMAMSDVLATGLPVFFPTWEKRFAFVSSLHDALSSAPLVQSQPCRLALAVLGQAAHSFFSGSSGVVAPYTANDGLSHPSTTAQAEHILSHLRLADQSWLSERLFSAPSSTSGALFPRRLVYLLVSYLSQLYMSLQPAHFSPAAARSYSALTNADNRNLSALLPFLTLSTAVMKRVNALVRFTLLRLQRLDGETPPRPSAAAVLDALRSCALFHILPPLMCWLPEVMHLVACGAYEHYTQLDATLHQLVPLIVDLARILRPSDPIKPLPLPQLIASLREARQLTTLQSQQGVHHRALTSFARQVFTGVFRHFASTQPDGGDRELMMSCDDFIRLYSHCHLPPTVAPQQSAASSASTASPSGAPPSIAVFVPIHSSASQTPTAPPSTAAATVRSSINGTASSVARFSPYGVGPIGSGVRVIAISDAQSGATSATSSGSSSTSAASIAISVRDPFRSPLQSPSPPTSSTASGPDTSVTVTIVRPASHSATSSPSSAPLASSQQAPISSHAATAPLPVPSSTSSASQPERQPLVRPPFPLVLLPSIGISPSSSSPTAQSSSPPSSAGAGSAHLSRSPSSTSVSISATGATRARLLFYKLVLHASKQSGSEPADSNSVSSLAQRQCINLRTFLRFQLEQCKADSAAVMDQLRVLQTSIEWSKTAVADSSPAASSPASDLPPVKLTAESLLDDLKRVYSSTLTHLYPALSIVHNAPNPHLPADQLPNIVSMSTLPGITPPPATSITSPQLEYEDVVEKLMESQAHWSQHTAYKQHKDFLQRFVLYDAERLQRHKERQNQRRQARTCEQRQRAVSDRDDRQTSPTKDASKGDGFAATVRLTQHSVEAESTEADDAANEAAERRSKQLHDRHIEPDDEELRRFEEHVKAQHDDSDWQPQEIADPTDEQPASSPKPSPVPSPEPADTIAPSPYEISEPALCLSALLHRCLSEMGGGYVKRRVELWREALAAERAYAAACIKHHGYTERAMRYSSSIAIVELLRRALQPNSRTRCLAHPSLPQWFKSVVQATFRDVRSPLLAVLRELDEPATDDNNEAATSTDEMHSGFPTSDPVVVTSSATTQSLNPSTTSVLELSAAAQSLVRHAQSNLAALQLEYTSLTSDPQQRSQSSEATAASVESMDSRMAAMLANVTRTRQELEDANNNLRRHITLMDDVVRTRTQRVESADDKRIAKLIVEEERAARRMQVKLDAVTLASDCYRNAWFIVSGIDSVQLNVTTDMPGQQWHSVAFDADEHKPPHKDRLTAIRTSATGSRRRHSLLSIQPSQHSDLQQLAADVLQQSQADFTHGDDGAEQSDEGEQPSNRGQADNQEPAMTRSYSTRPRHQANQLSVHSAAAAAPSLWSTWSVSSAASRHFDSQSFDSAWINQLVHSKSTTQLADSLQPAIQRYHTVSRLRLRLVHLINSQFRGGKRAELLAHIIPSLLPCLSRAKHGSHLLYNSGLLLREDESQRTLLSFYKHIVDALNSPTGADSSFTTVPLSFSSSSWPVLRQCLHLFNVDFLPEDAEAVVGSGIFAALSRWMTQIDKVLDKHRIHQLESAANSAVPSAAASRTLTRSHTRSNSLIDRGSEKGVTSCPAAYALKRLMWQTYTYLASFYLSQQQQHAQRQQQLDSQTQMDSSLAASAELSKGGNVVSSSLSAMYASMLLGNLARLSRTPPRIHFHIEDGLLRETHDAAVMMLHLARLKQPALSPVQLARLVQLVPFAPPVTQQSIVQLLGHEVNKVSPREFDQHINQSVASSTLTSASLNINSAAALTSALLGHLADMVDKASANSSLGSASPLLASQPRRSVDRDRRDSADSKQQLCEPAIDLDEGTWRQRMRGLLDQAGSRTRAAGASASDYPTFASPEAVLSSSASASTYQEWRSGEEQQFNSAQLAVLEELILVLRSMCQDRGWRRLVLPQLVQPVLTLPPAVNRLRAQRADSAAAASGSLFLGSSSASSLCHFVSAGCASLSVLGGWSFCLRRGAYVEVNMQGDFAADLAAPATSSLLPSTSATIHRGFVQSVDFDAHTASVLISPSQPRISNRLYRMDDSMQSAGPTELACVTFSFDQLRSIPAISAPNLNDQSSFATLWSALSAVLHVPPSTTLQSSINSSLHNAAVGVGLLVQAHVQRLTLGVVHSQAIMAARLQASTRLSIQTRNTLSPALDESLTQPMSPSFGELLASPVIEPLTLSPPPSTTEEGSDTTTTSLPTLSLASSNDRQSNVTWTLQPLQPTSLSSLSVTSQPTRDGSMTSRRSPVSSPEPRLARQPVDYSVFVSSAMQLSKAASHNFLFSLTPFGVDNATRQLSHRLSSVLSLDVQRRQRVSSLATRLSRVASRATSRAITRSASLHASGTVTPASHGDSNLSQEQAEDVQDSFASLPTFPHPATAALTSPPRHGSPLLVADDSEFTVPSSGQLVPDESPLSDWSAATSQSPSSSSLPHFIHDPSDPLHTPIWSPSPRLDRIIHRLQAQLPHSSATGEQSADHGLTRRVVEQQNDESETSEPSTPGDGDETREMHVHDEEEPVDHADTMFAPHDRPHAGQNDNHTDNDYAEDLFDDDEQLDAILDQQPPPLTPSDFLPPLHSSSLTDHVIFHYLYGLVSLGYPDHCARFALARCGGNLHGALEFLLSGEITLYNEYTHVGAAMMAFQHLLYRMGVVDRDVGGLAIDAATAESAPVLYRHISVAQQNDRELLLSAIQHLSEQQSTDLSTLSLYDWVDGRDSYGKRFLAQIVRKTVEPPCVTVHFMGWHDQFNEKVPLPSERLQPVTALLIDQTRMRLESERQISRVKVTARLFINGSPQRRPSWPLTQLGSSCIVRLPSTWQIRTLSLCFVCRRVSNLSTRVHPLPQSCWELVYTSLPSAYPCCTPCCVCRRWMWRVSTWWATSCWWWTRWASCARLRSRRCEVRRYAFTTRVGVGSGTRH